MVRSLIPWGERLPRPLERLEQEMQSLMDRYFGEDRWGLRSEIFSPRVDVVETDNEFEVTVDLPGLKAEDFEVEFENGSLVIRGEKKEEKEERGKTYHRIERYTGEFRRMIPLPSTVDTEHTEAEYTDGVLRVRVPKTEEAQPKRIPVKA